MSELQSGMSSLQRQCIRRLLTSTEHDDACWDVHSLKAFPYHGSYIRMHFGYRVTFRELPSTPADAHGATCLLCEIAKPAYSSSFYGTDIGFRLRVNALRRLWAQGFALCGLGHVLSGQGCEWCGAFLYEVAHFALPRSRLAWRKTADPCVEMQPESSCKNKSP